MSLVLIIGLVLSIIIPSVALYMAKAELESENGNFSDVLKIKIEHPGNEDFIYINLNTVVINSKEYLRSTDDPDERYPLIAHKLVEVPGVTEVSVKKYQICLQKGDAFEFEEDILPRALELIKEIYGKGKEIEMLPTYDNRENAKRYAETEARYRNEFGDDSFYDDIH